MKECTRNEGSTKDLFGNDLLAELSDGHSTGGLELVENPDMVSMVLCYPTSGMSYAAADVLHANCHDVSTLTCQHDMPLTCQLSRLLSLPPVIPLMRATLSQGGLREISTCVTSSRWDMQVVSSSKASEVLWLTTSHNNFANFLWPAAPFCALFSTSYTESFGPCRALGMAALRAL